MAIIGEKCGLIDALKLWVQENKPVRTLLVFCMHMPCSGNKSSDVLQRFGAPVLE